MLASTLYFLFFFVAILLKKIRGKSIFFFNNISSVIYDICSVLNTHVLCKKANVDHTDFKVKDSLVCIMHTHWTKNYHNILVDNSV